MSQHTQPPNGGARSVPNAFDAIYTPTELAERWKLSEQSIRRLFQDEAGVLKIGGGGARGKRAYVTLRIPRAVVERVFQERSK
ncbi:MAG: hypothetical protein HY822_02020 [Acidobacteria bacterium]|nr:hypothetical protein [Acidobacteriota bacterium]